MREPRTSYQAFLDEVEEQRKADEAAIARMLSDEKPVFVSGKRLLWFFAKIVFWSLAVAAFVIGMLSL
jgi:hypothetical protein